MKLPEDKQQRVKVFIMIGLAAILVGLGIVQGIINPLIRSRKTKQARLEECRTGLEQARRDIRAAAGSLAQRMQTVSEIKTISDRYLLAPVLGNYLLGASAKIETMAQDLNIPIEPVREVGISQIPGGKDVASYTVRVNVTCSYHALLRLLREIESSNPYVCVTSIVIRGQPERDPESHNVSLEVQWPIWADPDVAAQLEEQLKEQNDKRPDIDEGSGESDSADAEGDSGEEAA
jgi:hypothetical protein